MSTQDNIALVRRFYEEMCNGRRLDLAEALFAADCQFHDPQIPGVRGPRAIAEAVKVYQTGVEGHWTIEDIFACDDHVAARWTGTGVHTGTVNGIPPTGKSVRVDAISVFRMAGGKIAESWEVWDTLGFLQQIGVVPK
jgi:steroid delta-isomerase-like uncharacterized protein